MPISGSDFETLVKPFFKRLFTDLGYFVLEVRKQSSGTQNGFDIKVEFEDSTGSERYFFIECKYYSSKLPWGELFSKQVQLSGSNYRCDAFIVLSPKENLSNIDDNLQSTFERFGKYPAEFWTPDNDVKELFMLDASLYQKVYDEQSPSNVDKDKIRSSFGRRIELLIQKKEALQFAEIIQINDTGKEPNESDDLRTSLDEKLDEVFSKDDARRLHFHQLRCNYKVYLEGLQDVNNSLRSKIISWQDDLRIKAYRLTDKFTIDSSYSPKKFYHDFFDDASKSMDAFLANHKLYADQEKLLHGVVFELAAECPLDWRNNKDE